MSTMGSLLGTFSLAAVLLQGPSPSPSGPVLLESGHLAEHALETPPAELPPRERRPLGARSVDDPDSAEEGRGDSLQGERDAR